MRARSPAEPSARGIATPCSTSRPTSAGGWKPFARRSAKGPRNAAQGGGTAGVNPVQAAPKPEIIYSTAYQKSQFAFAPLQKVLRQWNVEILKSNLAAAKLPDAMAVPLEPDVIDVADKTGYRGSAIWS